MEGIRVTPAQLESLAADVGGRSAEIEDTLSRLRARIEPLIDGEWAGQAAGEFQSLWAQWQRAAADLTTALHGIGQLLRRAGDAYAQAEASIAASFRR